MDSIKDLRIARGMTQAECAEYLGISRRRYQQLEANGINQESARYQHYCALLKQGEKTVPPKESFHTRVLCGDALAPLHATVASWKRRRCYKYLQDFVHGNYIGKVCILYGLRRTGKTTMIFQLLGELDPEITAYLKMSEANTMGDLIKDLNLLKQRGYRYVFIDEITLLQDFINAAGTLSDIYANMGMKLVLSGTDSLGFAFADMDELYDRNVMIHTSFIPFGEFCEVLGDKGIDEYIEYGGTLKAENMGFDDPDYKNDEVCFRNDESTRKYIDTSIVRNIQRSLRNDLFEQKFAGLRALYEKGELTNAINRIIDDMNHRFLLSVVERKFHSSDYGSGRNLLLREEDPAVQTALYDIDAEEVFVAMKSLLDIKEKEETTVALTQEDINQIRQYLLLLDLIRVVKVRYDNGSSEQRDVFVQPGMRYAITKALVHSLLQNSRFLSYTRSQKQVIIDKILNDVKGRMLEDIVLLETSTKRQKEEVFQYRFVAGGEFDMVRYPQDGSFQLYEIKHSKEIVFESQTKYLRNPALLDYATHHFGQMKERIVLYRGEDTQIEGIVYQNVENYLKGL